ncbi:MAG: AAA family ATPase [Cyanobacteria bacterium P01_A01_bin.105]
MPNTVKTVSGLRVSPFCAGSMLTRLVDLPNYSDLCQIHESRQSLIYRGQRTDGQAVILKLPQDRQPSAALVARYQQEYQITQSLSTIDGVVKAYEGVPHEHSYLLVFEDIQGISLGQRLQGRDWERGMPVAQFLPMAIAIAQILGDIHTAQVIHKDITPANIILNPHTGALRIIDFGIATRLSRTLQSAQPLNRLEGTLAYMAPEQTGRMNRPVDYRSDFYGLGATFYHLLTGRKPFDSRDPLALIHCHLAQPPVAPHQLQPSLPEALSAIVLKLMAKTAEDRYQSAWGLKTDLERCQNNLTRGHTAAFSLGQQDVSPRFQISQRLYGRGAEVQALIDTFDLTVRLNQPQLIAITGAAGVGKSALVQELYKPLTKARGLLIQGKFDQFQRNVPYSAFAEAFSGWVQQRLGEPETQVNQLRSQLQTALGNNAQVIISLIPELSLLLGPQPEVPPLKAMESQNRFQLVFQAFLQVVAQPERPLVLFLDDLQWADSASLALLAQSLSATAALPLMVIGAYREQGQEQLAPFWQRLKSHGQQLPTLTLSPLPITTLNHLVADSLHCSPPETLGLTQLIHTKTNGNPFFVSALLQSLHDQGHIQFEAGQWQWDEAAIQQSQLSDNVVELMTAKLNTLAPAVQQMLSVAACVGQPFSLAALTTLLPEIAIAPALWTAIEQDFIRPQRPLSSVDALKPDVLKADALTATPNLAFYFTHDRIQQAAYERIGPRQRSLIHWQISQWLLTPAPQRTAGDHSFEIATHLQLGQAHLTLPAERRQAAQWQLRAGQQAKQATAYQAAWEYCQTGLSFLPNTAWDTDPDLMLQLHQTGAEAAALLGQFEEMETLLQAALQQLRHRPDRLLDKAELQCVRIQAAIAQNQLTRAVALALSPLRELGVHFPKRPKKRHVVASLIKTQIRLRGKSNAEIKGKTQVKPPRIRAILRYFQAIGTAAYATDPDLSSLIIFKVVRLSLRHGLNDSAVIGYLTYGFVLCGVLGKVETGYRFGQLAIDMMEQLDNRSTGSRCIFLNNYLVRHWREPLRQILPDFAPAYQLGLETGDLEYAAYNLYAPVQLQSLLGQPLHELQITLSGTVKTLGGLHQDITLHRARILQQFIDGLTRSTDGKARLDGPYYDAQAMQSVHQRANDRTTLFVSGLHQLILSYLLGDIPAALQTLAQTEAYAEAAVGTILLPYFTFFAALTQIRDVETAPPDLAQRYGKQIQKRLTQLNRWAAFSPDNYQDKAYLVAAEYHRIQGHTDAAMTAYQQAIHATKQQQYLHLEALTHELTGRFYLGQHHVLAGHAHLEKARYCYDRWQARAKVRQLEREFPSLVKQLKQAVATIDDVTLPETLTDTAGGTSKNELLDLQTILKASQAITGEIELEQLLKTLMDRLLENAGAQSGALILEAEGQLCLVARGQFGQADITLASPCPLASAQQMATSLVNYVVRTNEVLVIDNAPIDPRFSQDAYISQQQPKSLLCAPLINQGRTSGYVYLENNLTTRAFGPERLQVVNILSSQAAIAIDNARLYTNLKSLNQAYARFVPQQFLSLLKKDSIVDVQLGDQVELDMSVLFSDIRAFTTLSETMTPEESFQFINSYLQRMEPIILEYNGFIDKYIGDAIMALFGGSAEDAVNAGISMLRSLMPYNTGRQAAGYAGIDIGIGINTGALRLGTVGGPNRMDGTVISDAVNLGSRIESLTKVYQTPLLISHQTYRQLPQPDRYHIRKIDQVQVKGKSEQVIIYEVFDADPDVLRQQKQQTQGRFSEALMLYHQDYKAEALAKFRDCVAIAPDDAVAKIYLTRCQ